VPFTLYWLVPETSTGTLAALLRVALPDPTDRPSEFLMVAPGTSIRRTRKLLLAAELQEASSRIVDAKLATRSFPATTPVEMLGETNDRFVATFLGESGNGKFKFDLKGGKRRIDTSNAEGSGPGGHRAG